MIFSHSRKASEQIHLYNPTGTSCLRCSLSSSLLGKPNDKYNCCEGLMERRGAVSSGFPRKRNKGPMFTKTQGSARGSIYFPDNFTESTLARLSTASHSTTIHLCATGFIYTLQTFIRANLTGRTEKAGGGIEYTEILIKTQLPRGADSV